MRKLRYKFVCNFDGPITYYDRQKVRFDLVSHDYVDDSECLDGNINEDGSMYVIDKDLSNRRFHSSFATNVNRFGGDITDEIVSQITEYKLKLRKLKLNKV